ncbi:DUF262 domain-containing protein [Nocardioides sp. 616]|uniref:DUF262 domain-containing protein n=1 Tax=Nocardioides sp. 616 TaxID=2268090 RepID=UPI000CE4EA34|nr:DUF262 domain-containing protein [Nocardioides sp. 616]
MQGNPRSIANILNASSAYRIPPYQRAYQWEAERWQGLAHDVQQLTMKPKGDPPHWLGILLLSDDTGTKHPGDDSVQSYTVIDGQQRLTTTILWLAALAHHAKDNGRAIKLDVSKFAALHVQEIDRLPFKVALEGKWRLAKNAPLLGKRPLQAYAYFRYLLHLGTDALAEEESVKYQQLMPEKAKGSYEAQWDQFLATKRGSGVPRGQAVDCELLAQTTRTEMSLFSLIHDPKTDESQATIFDTLNGMRTPLEPLDHVRNSLFVRLPEADAKDLYEKEWKDTEDAIRNVRMKRMASEKVFLYDYLIAHGEKRRQKALNANRGAAHFSVMTRNMDGDALLELLREDLLPSMASWPVVVRQSDTYRHAGVKVEIPVAATQLLTSLYDLSANPANPIALHFVTQFALGNVESDELVEALLYAEAYIVRQMLAGKSLSPLRARIMDVMGKFDRSIVPADLLTELQASVWPTDDEIKDIAHEKPAYADLGARPVTAILRGIEAELSGAGSMFFVHGKKPNEYTIEHLFPQKHAKWDADIAAWGADPADMSHRLHALGNLAVVTGAHNSAVGNSTFADKKAYPTKPGKKVAPMAINAGWLAEPQWTEEEIDKRTDEFITSALARWSF